MQHPLKTNEAFQAAYSSAQDRKDRRLLTASNVDSLVISLGRLQQQHGREATSPEATPPAVPTGSFTNTYINQRRILEPPLPPAGHSLQTGPTYQGCCEKR